MTVRRMRPAWAVVLAACGEACAGGGVRTCKVDGGAVSARDMFPLAVGAIWVFDITAPGSGGSAPMGTKTQTVTGITTRKGVDGDVFVLETTRPNGEATTSYQRDIGAAVVRYSEDYSFGTTFLGREVYDPCKVRTPKTLYAAGAHLTHAFGEEAYDSGGGLLSALEKTETFVVDAVESVTVPAGAFNSAVNINRTSATTTSDKRFWYVEGVGKIREDGGGQSELLRCFRIPGGMESCGLCDAACQPL